MKKTEIKMSDKISQMSDIELDSFIRERLVDGESKKRFDMSGYGEHNQCHMHNTDILNLFADCGIYDRMTFLYLDAYKGVMTLYYMGWNENETISTENYFSGYGTIDILKEILKISVINCAFQKRRMH